MGGVAAADDLGDVQSQDTHTLGVGDVFQGGDDGAQVASHQDLQSQQGKSVLFGAGAVEHDLVVFVDDAFGERRISLQQCLGGIPHRATGQGTHFGDGGSQGVKLLIERGPHMAFTLGGRACGR